MTIIDSTKSLVENLYLISGPILAVLGFVAILQLRLTKKAIIITSKRQAAELSSKQIDYYTNQIIPLQDELYLIEEEQKIERLIFKDLIQFTYEEIEKKINNNLIKKKIKELDVNADKILRIVNAMESFSTYFIKGVADEEIAYSSIGRTFCHSVENYSFDISFMRREDDLQVFNNLVALYHIWKSRLNSEKISKELLNKQNELKKIQIKKVDILGAK
ncbi:hypothetical protein SL053_001005 [Flavobacterium psychrophilum]|uniref:DUF4760 domain-containing protein n=1 Tax=Flavobacterium psychrophilum TaxID=96345 RepID=UPI000B7C1878|nr:hypothetical protein [Flavobacterium psychrophilum]EKT4548463.1 hypothetical protein [Flavobacterium psychrophilum]ELV7524182.1 hypothetical protein [Flavobacterium psychrophilum]ELY2017117.1 hypothetical protein [Flavobacterium psychrophilum]MCB6062469.1 hypothetical protein [Flavobacterium psychrophilum]MCB6098221.1 hypothetical protein [Flavobacterium psychrophilum]